MIPRASFILVPILASSFTVLLFFCKEVRAQTNPTQPAVQLIPQHQRIEEKALLAKPEDPDSIRALATDVLDYQMRFPRMPAALESTVKERLVRAEMHIGDSINATLSPLQSVYLIIHVIDHKIWDADFQLTPAEWEKDQYSKSME